MNTYSDTVNKALEKIKKTISEKIESKFTIVYHRGLHDDKIIMLHMNSNKYAEVACEEEQLSNGLYVNHLSKFLIMLFKSIDVDCLENKK